MGEKVNKRRLAKWTGFSERTITEWQAEGMPFEPARKKGGSNKYDTTEVVGWLIDRASKSSSVQEARERLLRIQGDRQELQLGKERGQSLPASLVRGAVEKMVLACRSRLLAIPAKTAPRVVGCSNIAEVEAVLKKDVHEALDELADTDVFEGDRETAKK